MLPDDPSDPTVTRHLLPEEEVAMQAGEKPGAEAAEILRESEERVVEASAGNAPADAADEHRRSEDTV